METITARSSDAILYEEHNAVEAVLGYMGRALDLLERSIAVEPGFFRDLLEFARAFVGQCHHGKEEHILFPILRATSADAEGLIAELERDHAHGVALTDALEAAVTAYARDGMRAADALIAAGRRYDAYLRQHIRSENERLLPQARGIDADAQARLVVAFDRFEEDVMGVGTHERLHQMIDTLGPRLDALSRANPS